MEQLVRIYLYDMKDCVLADAWLSCQDGQCYSCIREDLSLGGQ